MLRARSLSQRALVSFFLALSATAAGCGGGAVSTTPVPVSGMVATSLAALVATQSTAVNLGPVAKAANLWTPVTGHPHVGIVIMHPYSSYKNFMACPDLAARGFTLLCIDSLFTNLEDTYYGYEQHAPAIAAGINYLRALPGITKVLIFGHSAGAPMMSFYENVAEHGPSVCSDAAKISPCITTNLSNVPQADGLIMFDSHLGESLATYSYVDPAIENNTFGQRDPSLDMFSVANGYNLATNGASYSPQFVQTFLAGQASRNAQLLAQAQALLAQERQSNPSAMGDDIPFDVVGAKAARLWQPDLGLLNCTQNPVLLLSHDGTRPIKVICSVRPPSGAAATGLTTAANFNETLHVWLGAHSLRTLPNPPGPPYNQTLNDLTGIDWTSTATSSIGNIGGINKPFLIVGNSGHYFLRTDEIIYQTARMSDKTFAIEEGAVHGGTECTQCEALLGLPTPAPTGTPGPGGATAPPTFGYYGDTFSRSMNYMAEWINDRY
jgi:pimeloyl-ACP methyl ester carboxylesterase